MRNDKNKALKVIDTRLAREISDPLPQEDIINVHAAPRYSLIISRFVLFVGSLIALVMLAMAGRDIGYLVGLGIPIGISLAIFEVVARLRKDGFSAFMSAIAALLFLIASDFATNIISMSVSVGESTQNIARAGIVGLGIGTVAYMFRKIMNR